MARNEITSSNPRIGWLITDDTTQQFTGMLTLDDEQLRLTLPTPGMSDPSTQPSPLSARDALPISGQEQATVPHELLFHDTHGSIALIGCSATSWTQGEHSGKIGCQPDFAILGAKTLGYSTIQGMRIDMPALIPWTGLNSIDLEVELNADRKVNVANVRAESPDDITILHEMNVHIRPTWETSRKSSLGQFDVREIVEIATSSSQPTSWEQHLRPVTAIRDLLVIAGWQNFGFRRVSVNRQDDPERALSGDAVGDRWARVVTHRLPTHQDWAKNPWFLFTLSDIGPEGVSQFIKFRETYRRAIGPLVGIASRPDAFLEARLMHSGVSIEAAGYAIRREAGITGKFTYHAAAEALIGQLPFIPIDDPEQWADRSTKAYRQVKHADNSYPDTLEMLDVVRQNCLMLRYWVAAQLGTSTETLKRRADSDPLRRPIELA